MSSTTSKQNKAAALKRTQALIAGMQKHLPNAQFTFGSTAYTTASIVQALQALAGAFAPVDAAHATLRDSVAALRAIETKTAPLLRDLRGYLRATYSDSTTTLADFGLTPPAARAPLTGERRVVATAKAKATRTARGTASKKQKLAIAGDVKGVVITPVTSTAPATPPAAPAGPAPATTAPAVAAK